MDLLIEICLLGLRAKLPRRFVSRILHPSLLDAQTAAPAIAVPLAARPELAFSNHNVLHHERSLQGLLNHEDDPAGRTISLRLDLWIGLVAGLLIGLALYPLSLVAGPVFVTVLLLHHLAWNLIHDEMHNPLHPRWFGHSWFFRFFARYHWMHHKYPGKNYNVVLPCADFIFGKYARPTAVDRSEMRAIGI